MRERGGNAALGGAIRDEETVWGTDSGGGGGNGNTAPTGDDDEYTVGEDETLQVNATDGVLANDEDEDDDALTAALVSGPSHGTLTLDSDGSFEYVPDADFTGTDTFTYVAYDGTTISEPVTVTVTVEEANDAPVAAADAYSVDENDTLTVSASNGVLKNDTDEDGDDLSAVLVTNPSHGTIDFDSDGSFKYVPDVNFAGTDTFTYYATDGTSHTDAIVVTITVNEGNDAPVGTEDSYTVDEDGTLTVNAASGVLKNDTDADGDDLEAALVDGPSNGTLTLDDDGSFTYEPDADFNGTDTFTYYATDGDLDSEEITVTITVNPVNDAPVAADDAYTTTPGDQLDVTAADGILSNDVDVDGDSLTVTLVDDVAHGTLTLGSGGAFTYVPESGYHGIDTFTYTISDGTASSEEVTVEIHVNTPADAEADAYTVDEDGTLTVNATDGVLANDEDSDGDTLTAVLVTGPEHGTLELNADGSFTYTPDADFHGTDTFTYASDDDFLNPSEATVTITVDSVNDAPVAADDAYTTTPGDQLTVTAADGFLSNDVDVDGDSLTVTLVNDVAHGTLTLGEGGAFTYVPQSGYHGIDTFTYKVNDGTADSEVVTVEIHVNTPADAEADAYTVDEDGTLTVNATDGVLENDEDDDDDTLTAVLVTGPEHGTLQLNSDGSFTYTPDADFHGTDTFTYASDDDFLNPSEATVTITVNPVNDAPVAAADAYVTAPGDQLAVTAADGILSNDVDVDGDSLTVTLVDDVAYGTLTLGEGGAFTYVPQNGYHGIDTFTYTISDGTDSSEVVTVEIHVNTPADAEADAYSIDEDGTLQIDAAAGVLANDEDADDDTLTAVLVTGPEHGTLELNADGSFTYTPDADFHGTDTFTYASDDGFLDPSETTVTITVNSVNDAPVGVDDAYTTTPGDSLVVTVANGFLSNDSDADNSLLTVTLVDDVAHGTLTLGSGGAFVYVPQTGYHGIDTFTYTISDGTASSEVVTVEIHVNTPADADADAYSVDEDGTLTVNGTAGVLANDDDSDDDSLTAVLVTGPEHGTLQLNEDGSFTYTPDADFYGTDTFTYAADDNFLNPSEATVTITVNPVNDAPVATDDAYTTTLGDQLTVTADDGFLNNDTDVEGDSLTVTLVDDVAHGTLTLGERRRVHVRPADRVPRDRYVHIQGQRRHGRFRSGHRRNPREHAGRCGGRRLQHRRRRDAHGDRGRRCTGQRRRCRRRHLDRRARHRAGTRHAATQ